MPLNTLPPAGLYSSGHLKEDLESTPSTGWSLPAYSVVSNILGKTLKDLRPGNENRVISPAE